MAIMDSVITRRRGEYNDRMQLAHFTAQFTRANPMPDLKEFMIDVHERPTPNSTADHDPDDGLLKWALVIATEEQRKELLCL